MTKGQFLRILGDVVACCGIFSTFLKAGINFFDIHIGKLKKKYNFALAQKMSIRRDQFYGFDYGVP